VSRAWEAAVNAEFVAKVQKIVEEWRNGETDDHEAMEELEDLVEITG
jgi:hypothetical protein